MKTFLKRILIIIAGVLITLLCAGYGYTTYKESKTHEIPSVLQRATTTDGFITYITYGESSNQPVLLLHGTGANSFIWEKTSVFLAEKGYYVIAIDIPPFGWSSIPESQNYRKEEQASRIIQLMTSISVINPIIVGHSFNSKIALQITEKIHTKKLILVAPVLTYKATEESLLSALSQITILRDPLLSLFVNNPLLAEKILLSFMTIKDADISSVLTTTTKPFSKPGINHAYGEWFQEFFSPTTEKEDAAALRNISTPIDVIWGDKDTISPIETFVNLQTHNPSANLITIPGVGHMPHLEDVRSFNTLLLQSIK